MTDHYSNVNYGPDSTGFHYRLRLLDRIEGEALEASAEELPGLREAYRQCLDVIRQNDGEECYRLAVPAKCRPNQL